jgi:hypothetical protein
MLAALPFDDVRAESSPAFRLVLPRAKRDRLLRRVSRLEPRRVCAAEGCAVQGLAVVLVDAETEAVLCPYHELVGLDGVPVEGQPMVVTAAW